MSLNPTLYLASNSPRRASLLEQLQLSFIRLELAIDETPLNSEPPLVYAERIAWQKAQAGVKLIADNQFATLPVLAADTIVTLNQEIIGKPQDIDHAQQILECLSGQQHQVITVVALATQDKIATRISVSDVTFRRLAPQEITDYLATGESLDKAGAYAVQGLAAIFIKEIKGSYSGIMGLPLYETAELLTEFGHPCLPPPTT